MFTVHFFQDIHVLNDCYLLEVIQAIKNSLIKLSCPCDMSCASSCVLLEAEPEVSCLQPDITQTSGVSQTSALLSPSGNKLVIVSASVL